MNKPGNDNVVTDFLSRLNINNEDTLVVDSFPDEHIFKISTNTPQYANVANYLDVGKVPHHLSHKKQRRIIQQIARYIWIEG